MPQFISAGLAWVAYAAARSSCEHQPIRAPRCRGSAFGQGEDLWLCLQDTSWHALVFQPGLSWLVRAGGEARPCKWPATLAAEKTAAGAGKWRCLSRWSAVAGLRLASAIFTSHRGAGRAFWGSSRVLDGSRGVLPLPTCGCAGGWAACACACPETGPPPWASPLRRLAQLLQFLSLFPLYFSS